MSHLHPSSTAISHKPWQGLICNCFCLAHLHLNEAEGSWCFKGRHQGRTRCCEDIEKAVILFTADTKNCAASFLHPTLGRVSCGEKHVFLIWCTALHCCLLHICTNMLTNLLKMLVLPANCPFGYISPVPFTTMYFYQQKNLKWRVFFFFHIQSAVQSFLGFHSGQRHSKSTSKILLRLLHPIIFTTSFPAQPKQLLPFCLQFIFSCR